MAKCAYYVGRLQIVYICADGHLGGKVEIHIKNKVFAAVKNRDRRGFLCLILVIKKKH